MTMERELRVRFDVDGPDPLQLCAQQVLAVAWGITLANVAWFAQHPDAPCCLGCAGVRYTRPEKCGVWCQWADTAPIILRRRIVTCLGAAPYAAAKKIAKGIDAGLWLEPLEGAEVEGTFHLVVRLPDGSILDPTAKLKPGECSTGVCDAA